MLQIVCDSKKIESVLRKLCDLIKSNGGFIHDDLSILCEDNFLKITGPKTLLTEELIISVPEPCFMPTGRMQFSSNNDKILIDSHDDEVSALQLEIAELMIELYNLTDKLSFHKKTSLLALYFEDPDFYKSIAGNFKSGFLESMQGISEDDALCHDFIFIRSVFHEEQHGDERRRTMAIMPILDCINHRTGAPGIFMNTKEGQSYMSIIPFMPKDADEFMANYGPYDTKDFFFRHGYVDPRIIYVRAPAMEINIKDIATVRIMSGINKPNIEDVPENFQDLDFYLPMIKASEKDRQAQLSFLYIPQEVAPRAMRRILSHALQSFVDTDETLKLVVLSAEREVVGRSLKYYESLSERLEGYKPGPKSKTVIENARQMAKVQIDKIKSYPFYEEAMKQNAA